MRLVANRGNILVSLENIANEKLNQSHMAGWFHGFQLSNVSVTFVPLLCFYISLIYFLFFYFIFLASQVPSLTPVNRTEQIKQNSIEPTIKLFRTKEFQSMLLGHKKEIEHHTF